MKAIYTIERDGEIIELTKKEICEICSQNEYENYLNEAEYFVKGFLENFDISDDYFKQKMGYTIEQAFDPDSSHYILNDIIKRFKDKSMYSSNGSSIWQDAVESLLYCDLIED